MNHITARPLHDGFLRSGAAMPERPALEVEGRTLTFAALRDRAASLAATLERATPDADPPLTAVFAYRSETAFAGVLGALLRGHGYVPLHPRFPIDRTRTMLERASCAAVIVDSAAAEQLDDLLAGIDRSLVLVLPEHSDVAELAARWPAHTFLGAGDLRPASEWTQPEVDPNGIAYLLFTSGSTGIPKGVMVAHRNATAFIDVMVDRYAITPEDRFSQTFDMTFDLSVFDMFVAWERGRVRLLPGRAGAHDAGTLHPRSRHHTLVLGAIDGRLHEEARDAQAGCIPRAASEPLLRRAAAGGDRARLDGCGTPLDRGEPLRSDGAHHRLHAVPMGPRALARGVRARRRTDRCAVSGHEHPGRRRRAARGRHRARTASCCSPAPRSRSATGATRRRLQPRSLCRPAKIAFTTARATASGARWATAR